MFRILLIGMILLPRVAPAAKTGTELPLKQAGLHWLEQRLDEIDTQLEQLSPISLRSGVGAVGFRSETHKQPDITEWIHIDLGKEFPIDEIVLVPTIGRDSETGLQADGFPIEFRILAGTAHTTNVVASFTEKNNLLPRIAPVVVPIDRLNASWVRLECTRLSARRWVTKHYTLQLSEIMVFSDMMNVALKKPIEVSSSSDTDTARHKRFLVDGFIPYLMDAAHGDRSPAPLFETDPEKTAPAVMIDLGASFPVNQINIHSIDLSHTIPEAVTDGYAIPRRFRVMGANDPSLKDATLLFEYTRTSIYDAGPVLMWNIPGTRCRYVQIVALEIDPNPLDPEKVKKIGFAEIEVFANSRNVALNQPVYANDGLKGPRRRLNQITDGNNFYGKILPLQDWMNQLARRHDLETERPRVAEELTRRYVRQKVNLTRAIWLIVLLLGGGIILILAEKLLRQRAITRTRERIAANLHDELGANLHAIGILGTYAKKVLNSPEKLIRTVDEIKSLTDRTGEATRYCAHIQTAIEDHENLADDLRRAARGMIANLEYDFVMKGEDILKDMKPRNRADLYLFFKESLVNINRHANATKVNIQLTCDLRTIHLDISDNGCGILENEKRGVPASLKRRARLLKANVSMEQSETGGTRITLQIQLHRPFCYIQRVKRKKSES